MTHKNIYAYITNLFNLKILIQINKRFMIKINKSLCEFTIYNELHMEQFI